jgi:hypothetical protein
MRRILSIIAGTLTIGLLTAAVALAGGGLSGTAKGHGQAVSDVAQAVTFVSGKARGEAVSALAKAHGAQVSAAAKSFAAANAAAGKAKGTQASSAQGANADEPGGLKDSISH